MRYDSPSNIETAIWIVVETPLRSRNNHQISDNDNSLWVCCVLDVWIYVRHSVASSGVNAGTETSAATALLATEPLSHLPNKSLRGVSVLLECTYASDCLYSSRNLESRPSPSETPPM